MIRKLIAEGRTDEALDNLSGYFDYLNEVNRELIGLKNRYANLLKEKDAGTLNDRDAEIRNIRINQALLNFFEQMEHELNGLFQNTQTEISLDSFKEKVQYKLIRSYKIVRQIAEGNTAIIYKAEDLYSHQNAAIRALKKQDFTQSALRANPKLLEQRKAIIEKLYTIRHRNIIRMIGTYLDEFPECMVLEYINSGTALSKILKLGSRPLFEVIHHVTKVGDALHYLHSKGIVHGKITPSKILVDLEQQPMISPFELFSTSYDHYGLDKLMDDLTYDSPEELAREVPHEKSDQFSLGLVAYELLTGKPLFCGESLHELFTCRGDFFHNKAYRKRIIQSIPAPRKIQLTLDKMLSHRPVDRFPSIEEALKPFYSIELALPQATQTARASYNRSCARNNQLIQSFYDRLFEAHPEMKPYFDKPSMPPRRRMRLVRSAIPLMLASDHNEHYLTHILGHSAHKGLESIQFEQFIDMIISTIQLNDYMWNDDIADAWQEIKHKVMGHVEKRQ
ncbi:MAG: protein kinase [Bacteroidota bacterium]